MDRNPKKSKALIITLVALVILIVGGYFLFKKSDSIFGTKSEVGTGKTFDPLLGTSEPKDLTTSESGGTSGANTNEGGDNQTFTGGLDTSPKPNSNTIGTIGTTGSIQSGGSLSGGTIGGTGTLGTSGTLGATTPQPNPLPTPGNTSTITPAPTGTGTGGNQTPIITTSTPISQNICQINDPLVFTDEEKAELALLLKQYYLIAPGLKTDDDIALAESDIRSNQDLIDQADDLLAACQNQKGSPVYTGPQTIKDNPYYSSGINFSGTFYIPSFSQLEQLFDIW